MMNQIKKWFQFPINSGDEDIENDNSAEDRQNDDDRNKNDQHKEQILSSSIKDSDFEYLFNQLLEGVINGWQENRIALFLEKLKPKKYIFVLKRSSCTSA